MPPVAAAIPFIVKAAAPALITAGVGAITGRKAKKEQKAAREHQEDVARQTEQAMIEATKMTPEEVDRMTRTFALEETRQPELERRAGLTGEQLIKEIGPGSEELLKRLISEGGMTGEQLFLKETGAGGQALINQITGMAEAPGAQFESTLAQQLKLAEDTINRRAAERGLLRSGVPLEQFGRAGVELAIGEARARQEARQTDLANAVSVLSSLPGLSQTALANLAEMSRSGAVLSSDARAELERLLSGMQGLTAQATGREAQGAVSGAQASATVQGIGLAERLAEPQIKAGQIGESLPGQIKSIMDIFNIGKKETTTPKTTVPSVGGISIPTTFPTQFTPSTLQQYSSIQTPFLDEISKRKLAIGSLPSF